MVGSPWPIRVAATYVAVTILSWALILGGASELGLKFALILGLPWSLLLADSSGSSLTAFLLFSSAILNALLVYVLLWLVRRRSRASQQGSAAA